MTTVLRCWTLLLAVGVAAGGGCSQAVGPSPAQAYRSVTLAQLKLVAAAIELFRGAVGRYPTDAEGVAVLVKPPADKKAAEKWSSFGPFLGGGQVPVDGWNRPIRYQRLPKSPAGFRVWSVGPDGADGTADDVVQKGGSQ